MLRRPVGVFGGQRADHAVADAGAAVIADANARTTNEIDLEADLYIHNEEGRRVAHEHLARAYTLVNITLIFSLFFTAFVVFERKETFDDS